MSIRLEQLEHRYPGTSQGLLGVSLEVARGELLAVIGASGCGKSTMLRLVAGLLPVQSGRLLIDDRDVAAVPPWGRSVGMVFQSYALFPHLSVLDNVAYGLRMRGAAAGERSRAAQAMIASMGLSGFELRRPSQLSGGQQQRVALARALAFRPSVLLLDEPLAALDAHIRVQLCDEIRDIQRASGAATLFVTHDQQEALMIADRVAVLQQGKLQQIDTPRGLYARPANVTVARFVGHANLLAGTVLEPGRVDTVLGSLHADTTHRPAGTKVCVVVRPESICPDPGPDDPNRIHGVAGRVRFLGATCRWDFVPAAIARPDAPSATLPTLLCEGAKVASEAVSLPPEALIVLDDECPVQ
jgi:putative spermidine/putrescine transport system ATP-binding protein